MRLVALLSCESTGTHFTQRALERMIGKPLAWGRWGLHGIIRHVYPEGVHPDVDADIAKAREGASVVVPMRHPVAALITNLEHTRTTERFPNPLKDHAASFGRVASWPEAFYFQVDTPHPDFDGLADHIGARRPFRRKMPNEPLNPTHPTKHTALRALFHGKHWDELDRELDGAVSVLRQHADFFERFGYELW